MLLSLTLFFKSRLKLSLFSGNNKHCNIGLACAHNHIWNIVFMSWSIKQSKSSFFKGKHHFWTLNSFASFPFIRINICNECKFPGLHIILLRFLFIACKLLLIYLFKFFHDIASQGRFSWIDMPNEDQIGILFSKRLFIRITLPLVLFNRYLFSSFSGIIFPNNLNFFFRFFLFGFWYIIYNTLLLLF